VGAVSDRRGGRGCKFGGWQGKWKLGKEFVESERWRSTGIYSIMGQQRSIIKSAAMLLTALSIPDWWLTVVRGQYS
jgi:hypothetical protein